MLSTVTNYIEIILRGDEENMKKTYHTAPSVHIELFSLGCRVCEFLVGASILSFNIGSLEHGDF